ncbi:MAG TPA: SAM-dependent methyltransferase, partial [Burkholderiales bacterium]|nr:SAM-dependent methyltransferase [Burkholderiales bacterium]
KATVITMFLLPDINLKLRPKILNLKPGTRIVSNTFTMGEWEADETGTAVSDEGSNYYRTALLWIVPAKVDGNWKLGNGELTLKQQYQTLSGTLLVGDRSMAISDGKMDGERISFSAGNTRYSGRVNGDVMDGTVGAAKSPWNATRGK